MAIDLTAARVLRAAGLSAAACALVVWAAPATAQASSGPRRDDSTYRSSTRSWGQRSGAAQTVDLSAFYGRLSADSDFGDADFDTLGIRGTWRFNEWFSLEGEAQFGVGGDEIAGIDVDLDHTVGAFARVDYPLGVEGGVFARGGYVDAEADADFPVIDIGDGWAYGVGGEYFFTGTPHGVRVDYTRYDLDETDVDAFSIAYVYRFGW